LAATLKPGVKFHPALAVVGQGALFTLSYSTLKIHCLRGQFHWCEVSFTYDNLNKKTIEEMYKFGVILVLYIFLHHKIVYNYLAHTQNKCFNIIVLLQIVATTKTLIEQ